MICSGWWWYSVTMDLLNPLQGLREEYQRRLGEGRPAVGPLHGARSQSPDTSGSRWTPASLIRSTEEAGPFGELKEAVSGVIDDLTPPWQIGSPDDALETASPLSWWLFRSGFYSNEPDLDSIASLLNDRLAKRPFDTCELALLQGVRPDPNDAELQIGSLVMRWTKLEEVQGLVAPALEIRRPLSVEEAKARWLDLEMADVVAASANEVLLPFASTVRALNLSAGRPVVVTRVQLHVPGWGTNHVRTADASHLQPQMVGDAGEEIEYSEPDEESLAPLTRETAESADRIRRQLEDLAGMGGYARKVRVALRQFERIVDLPLATHYDTPKPDLEEDVVLRCCFALEAALGDQPDLSFKLALRSSLLCGDTDADRETTFTLIRSAYKARSELVHGGAMETAVDASALWRATQKSIVRAMRLGDRKWDSAVGLLDAAAYSAAKREELSAIGAPKRRSV
jgi:hypothetical protein